MGSYYTESILLFCNRFFEQLQPFLDKIPNILSQDEIEAEFDIKRFFNIIKRTSKYLKTMNKKSFKITLYYIESDDVVVTNHAENTEVNHYSKSGKFIFQNNLDDENIDISTVYEKFTFKMRCTKGLITELNIDNLEEISNQIISYEIEQTTSLSIIESNKSIFKNFSKIDVQIPLLVDFLTSPFIIQINTNFMNPELKYQGDDRITVKFDDEILIIVEVKNLYYGTSLIEGNLTVNGINLPLSFAINKEEPCIYLASKNNRFYINNENNIPILLNKKIPLSSAIEIETLDASFNQIRNKVVIYDDDKKNKYPVVQEGNLTKVCINDDIKKYGTVYVSKDLYTNLFFDFDTYTSQDPLFLNPLTQQFEALPEILYSGLFGFVYTFFIFNGNPKIPNQKLPYKIISFENHIFKVHIFSNSKEDKNFVFTVDEKSYKFKVIPATGNIIINNNEISYKWDDPYFNNFDSIYYDEKQKDWLILPPEKPIKNDFKKFIIMSPFTYMWKSFAQPGLDCPVDMKSETIIPPEIKNVAYLVFDKKAKQNMKVIPKEQFNPQTMIPAFLHLYKNIEDLDMKKEVKNYTYGWVHFPNFSLENTIGDLPDDVAINICKKILIFLNRPKLQKNTTKEMFINKVNDEIKYKMMTVSRFVHLCPPCQFEYFIDAKRRALKIFQERKFYNANADLEKFAGTYEVLKFTKTTMEGLNMSDIHQIPRVILDCGAENINLKYTFPRAELDDEKEEHNESEETNITNDTFENDNVDICNESADEEETDYEFDDYYL